MEIMREIHALRVKLPSVLRSRAGPGRSLGEGRVALSGSQVQGHRGKAAPWGNRGLV